MHADNLDGGVYNQGSTSIQDGVYEDDDVNNQVYEEGVEAGVD